MNIPHFAITSLLASASTQAFSVSRAPIRSNCFQLDVANEVVPPHTSVESVWGIRPDLTHFPGASFAAVPGQASSSEAPPPILELPNFLSGSECDQVQRWALRAIDNGADECDEYLNYRVNQEVQQTGVSEEGRELIDEFQLDSLTAKHRGGFRVRLDPEIIETLLKPRILSLMGMTGKRDFYYEEGLWVRPAPHSVLIRDQTVVFYDEGNGVPPHVDGKDSTLLVYLSTVPEGVGGRTVFPEERYAQTPSKGTALFYRSKNELLHYSEAMQPGHEKWILQLLIDFNHDYQPGDLVVDYRTGTSYYWDGH